MYEEDAMIYKILQIVTVINWFNTDNLTDSEIFMYVKKIQDILQRNFTKELFLLLTCTRF